MKNTHFYMIRHGQSDHNAKGLMAGSIDTPLTDLGRSQAAIVRDLMPSLKNRPTHIIHSPLSRAADTAVIINETLNIPMISHDDLRELNMGSWEGQSVETYLPSFLDFKDPTGGETFNAFQNRVHYAILSNTQSLPTGSIPLIVSHGGVMRAFLKFYDLVTKRIGNCCLYEFMPIPTDALPWTIYEHQQDLSKIAGDLIALNHTRGG